jgi:xylitol oxidase
MEVVTGNGKLVLFSRDDDDFYGAVISLGGLGIVTKLTLAISPRFQMQQDVYENLPLKQLERHFEDVFSSTTASACSQIGVRKASIRFG